MSEVAVSIAPVNSTGSRTAPLLPPVALTPEEAAAVALALAAQPDGPFAPAGQGALEKVLAALEPDPVLRAELRAAGRRSRTGMTPVAPSAGSEGRSRHPAGRARPASPGNDPDSGASPAGSPRLVLLPGGLG